VLFELTERPVRDTIRVEVDGVRLDEGWTLQTTPAAIVFEQPPAAGAEIQVRYEVAT
jgi:hypothetical protein